MFSINQENWVLNHSHIHSHCDHDHDHDHAPHSVPDRIFKIGISLNLLFVAIEMYFGSKDFSLALISDAVHNLADVFGLIIAWLGYQLSKKPGAGKYSIYAAVVNTSLLLVTSIWIIVEAYQRYLMQVTPVAITVIVVASIGFIINLFSAKLFHQDHHHDLNIKSAYLHLMADAAISLGVVITGVIIYFKSIFWIDPLISAVISIIIIFGTWSFFKESLYMLFGKTPLSINIDEVIKCILREADIKSVKDIKIWALSTSENAMSARIQVSNSLTEKQFEKIKHQLRHDFKIALVEIEFGD